MLQGLLSTFYLYFVRMICRPSHDVPDVPLSSAALGYWVTLRKHTEAAESVNDRTWLLNGIVDHLKALAKHTGPAGQDPAMRELITLSLLQHLPLIVRCNPICSAR